MKYIIVHKDEITSEIRAALNLNTTRVLVPIVDYHGVELKLYIAPINDDNISKYLSSYIRFNKEEVIIHRDSLINGSQVSRLLRSNTRSSAFSDPEGKRASFTGGFKFNIPSGDSVSQDLLITEPRYVTGGTFKAAGANFGDRVDFQVMFPVDSELTIYVPIDTFVDGWYVDGDKERIESYPAKIEAGLKIRITYHNVGGNSVNFYANLKLHKV